MRLSRLPLHLAFAGIVSLGTACAADGKETRAAGEVADGARAADPAGMARAVAADSTVRAADAAIAAGHPWRATVLLAPVLRDPKRRTPIAVLVAARAAAAWEGWTEVDRLLARETWLDRSFGGEGRALLAHGALERNDDAAALSHATLALTDAADATARAERLVLLARALDRRNDRDSARAAYEGAAKRLPLARDWLLLRAAGVTADSAVRAREYAQVHVPAARARIPWTEAQALERAGDPAAAAARYAALGAMPQAFRLRLGLVMDSTAHEAIRRELVAFIRARSGTADARQATDVLDRAFPSLTPVEELTVARSAAETGPVPRALAAYQRALAQAPGVTPRDRLRYGELLARAGRYRDAITQLATVDTPASVAASAAYQRARALMLAGSAAEARAALADVAERWAADTAAAPAALYLRADLLTDDGRDDDARATMQELYRRYPTSGLADDARFRAAIIDVAHGAPDRAAAELDSLAALMPQSREANAARYWAGRAWSASGDSARARAHWRDVLSRDPLSYYAAVAARRLGVEPPVPWGPASAAGDTGAFPRVAAVDSAARRAALLRRLGLDVESRFEYDAMEASADQSIDRLLATAVVFRDDGLPSRAIRLAWRAIERGARQPRVYRLVYPVLHRDVLAREASARGLDPALVAGIIRQESSWNPHATSTAGARGLMQVMPAVGADVARASGFPVWDPALLYDPDANLELGTRHLAAFMTQYDGLPRVLAAYNAGGSRVARWSSKAGTDDPELFIERIPFVETRDYVRIVSRNAELYRALYEWSGRAPR